MLFSYRAVCCTLITITAALTQTVALAAPAEPLGTLDGKPFSWDCKTFKSKALWADVNSVGGLTVKFLAVNNDKNPPYGSMQIGLPSQQTASPYWKSVKVTSPTDGSGLIIEGIDHAGVAIKQELLLGDHSIKCRYTVNKPISVLGQFPAVWSANWFWANSDRGAIQGELWGTYSPLTVRDSLSFTYLFRRIRMALSKNASLTLTSSPDVDSGAAFSVASTKAPVQGESYSLDVEIFNLPPEEAPLPNGDAIPIVTKPFDRRKVIPGPLEAYRDGSVVKTNQPAGAAPSLVIATPKKGNPAVFLPKEQLAFTLKLATLPDAPATTEKPLLKYKCFLSLDDTLKQEGVLDVAKPELVLQSLPKGPYRLEFYNRDKKLNEDEFVVAGPVEQRVVAPGGETPFKLRLADRIDCGTDNGRHEFYSRSNEAKVVELPGLGKFMESSWKGKVGFDPGVEEWFGYRVSGFAKDKPHLLEVEYPDVDDMVMGIGVGQCLRPDNPLSDASIALLGGGVVTGSGHSVSGKMHKYRGVFYPYHSWGLLEFTRYNREPKPIRVARIAIYEILDDLPQTATADRENNRTMGVFDECLRQTLGSFDASGTMFRRNKLKPALRPLLQAFLHRRRADGEILALPWRKHLVRRRTPLSGSELSLLERPECGLFGPERLLGGVRADVRGEQPDLDVVAPL